MMPIYTIFTMLYVINTILISISATDTGNETDHLALLAFKSKITHDPRGVLKSWNDSTEFCQWEGVVCGHRHKRITALLLHDEGLAGTLSPYIGNFSFLRILSMSNNTLTGHIPPEVGRLFRLEILELKYNSFEGEIPANISGCLQLNKLVLSHNKLVGKIPFELRFLSRLQQLRLDQNNLTGDDLSMLANLTSLQALVLSSQIEQGGLGFQGSIPDFIGTFQDLNVLALGANSFTGKIPTSLYNLSMLQVFSLGTNFLEGRLPSEFGLYFPQLQLLEIAENRLTGPIPLSLSNLSMLEEINLSSNEFNGKFEFDGSNMQNLSKLFLFSNHLGNGDLDDLGFLNTLTNNTSFKVLNMNDNRFGGIIPDSIGNLSATTIWLDLRANLISGRIPFGFGNLLNLRSLLLSYNRIIGAIPADISHIPGLQLLDLSRNQLSGNIALSLENLTWLSTLDLSFNTIRGALPPTLANCTSLLQLDLNDNNLVGNIPYQLFQALTLYELKLDHNHLQGSIPSEISNLQKLVILDMSSNNLSGNVPSSLSQCVALTDLYIGSNSLDGFIPPSFKLLKGLEIVDLSHNKFSGQVPDYFSNFSSLKVLNLSFNNLEGNVPTKGVFTNLSGVSLVGNRKLCGGIPQLKLPLCPTMKSKGKKKSYTLLIAVLVSCVIIGLATATSAYLLCTRKKRRASSSETLHKKRFIKVSYDMLLKATNGYSPANLIGSGGFSSVYKGTLLLDGTSKDVAIKVMNNQQSEASKSFLAECLALRIIRHRNLVGVITACSSIDFQGNDFKALVYEFMSNGSLDRWLHPSAEQDEQFQSLSLLQRLNIAIDVAQALDYIHSGNETPIIHCNLKPTNILLDQDLTAHVGDFGLVKLLPKMSEQLYNSSSIGVRGTVGYAAPCKFIRALSVDLSKQLDEGFTSSHFQLN